MCAMMPMLRQRSRGKVRATAQYLCDTAPSRVPGLDEGRPEKDHFLRRRSAAFTQCVAPRQVKGRAPGAVLLPPRAGGSPAAHAVGSHQPGWAKAVFAPAHLVRS